MSENLTDPQTTSRSPEDLEISRPVPDDSQANTKAHTSDNLEAEGGPGLHLIQQQPDAPPRTESELLEAKNEALELKATAGDFFREQRFQEVT
jgi:hypothetical protein